MLPMFSLLAILLLILASSNGLLIEYPMSIRKAPFMSTVGLCDAVLLSREFALVSSTCLCKADKPDEILTGSSWNNVHGLPKHSKLSIIEVVIHV